jgi:hypothetical protein
MAGVGTNISHTKSVVILVTQQFHIPLRRKQEREEKQTLKKNTRRSNQ